MHEMGLGKPRAALAEEESQNEEEESGSDDVEVVVPSLQGWSFPRRGLGGAGGRGE
jgi:hypothetical protein